MEQTPKRASVAPQHWSAALTADPLCAASEKETGNLKRGRDPSNLTSCTNGRKTTQTRKHESALGKKSKMSIARKVYLARSTAFVDTAFPELIQ